MTYFLGFSGPPKSGKDTVANALAERLSPLNVQLLACSWPMRQVIYNLLGLDYSTQHYDLHKDDPQPMFGGKSIRQAMIALSEEHVKPTYGHEFWGRALLNQLWTPTPQLVIVTDLGFPAETDVFIDRFGIDKCVFVQMIRKGCDFTNDSRGYVGRHGRTISVINDDDVETAARIVHDRVAQEYGWDLS